jgi:5'-nucleotidase (lipoprotein e(P4) family)
MRTRIRIRDAAFMALFLVLGCAPPHAAVRETTVKAPQPSPAAPETPLALVWRHTSAEHHAAYLQTYDAAGKALPAAIAKQHRGRWAVILDIDETILDNSRFEIEQLGKQYDQQAFNAWCAREEAKALPGAHAFLTRVHALGGRVVLITNREDAVCEHTRGNLRKQKLAFDEVLCKTVGDDKNPRFTAVAHGQSPSTLPPLTVVMWLGDNIQDFPNLFQDKLRGAGDDAFKEFGRKYFVLPNPVYGSWMKNPLP